MQLTVSILILVGIAIAASFGIAAVVGVPVWIAARTSEKYEARRSRYRELVGLSADSFPGKNDRSSFSPFLVRLWWVHAVITFALLSWGDESSHEIYLLYIGVLSGGFFAHRAFNSWRVFRSTADVPQELKIVPFIEVVGYSFAALGIFVFIGLPSFESRPFFFFLCTSLTFIVTAAILIPAAIRFNHATPCYVDGKPVVTDEELEELFNAEVAAKWDTEPKGTWVIFQFFLLSLVVGSALGNFIDANSLGIRLFESLVIGLFVGAVAEALHRTFTKGSHYYRLLQAHPDLDPNVRFIPKRKMIWFSIKFVVIFTIGLWLILWQFGGISMD